LGESGATSTILRVSCTIWALWLPLGSKLKRQQRRLFKT
jgi:hypothetical protein